MKFTEFLEMDVLEEYAKITPSTELHTFQKTKVNCDTFSGVSIHSCPGRSAICQNRCYDAKSIKYLIGGLKNIKKSITYTALAMTDLPRLQEQLIKEVFFCTPVIRLHVGGDFVSGGHVKVWQEVAKCYPKTRFFGYTRSWRIPEINKELLILKDMPNVTIFASCDAETGLPPESENWRIAQMTHYDLTVPRTIQCPETTSPPTVGNCMACKLCWGDKRVKTNLFFGLHGQGRKIDPTLIISKQNTLYRR